MKTALVCIAIHEEPYIYEFIDYYLNKLGVNDLYIYDNSVSNTLVGYSSDEHVKIIHFPGNQMQMKAYQHFFVNFSKEYDWVCVFDVDEFLYLGGQTLNHFLEQECFEHASAIGVQWKLFGSSGNLCYTPEPVTKRFQKCDSKLNKHIKTIVRPREIIYMNNPHYIVTTRGTFHSTTLQPVLSPFCDDNSDNHDIDNRYDHNIFLAHYFTKSVKEFQQKIARGRSDISEKRTFEQFYSHDLNHVFDDSVCRFYSD